MIRALEMEDILKLMATDIDYDEAFIKIDRFWSVRRPIPVDDDTATRPVYLGPFSMYEPH